MSTPPHEALSSLVMALALEPHPEGGHYRRWHTSPVMTGDLAACGRGYPPGASRPASTSIFYLLPSGGRCKLHRIRGDELWLHQRGGPLVVVELIGATLRRTVVGPDAAAGHVLTHTVAGGTLFGAYCPRGGPGYALVSCVVSPGFSFEDWEMPLATDIVGVGGDDGGGDSGDGGGGSGGAAAQASDSNVVNAVAWLAEGGARQGHEDPPEGWL